MCGRAGSNPVAIHGGGRDHEPTDDKSKSTEATKQSKDNSSNSTNTSTNTTNANTEKKLLVVL
jgi:hypothetical protein